VCCSVLQCVALCYNVLSCVAICHVMLQFVAVCCSVLQCVEVCCSVSAPSVSPNRSGQLLWSFFPFLESYRRCITRLSVICCSTLHCNTLLNFLFFFYFFEWQKQKRTHSHFCLHSNLQMRERLRKKTTVDGRPICKVLQSAAVCCSVLQRVAACCSVLQCVAVRFIESF